ncbi:MAG: deoxyribose-phosphate aldolase [Acholeplasmataceae bacterium]|jgi:deoxyribose-phosphate aldolase|nr:deoxyribose-phosphate aldolase [Acholeplasmataceae bacterium]
MKLNKMIDHTKLGANVSKAQIDQLITEAKTYDFKSVCVNPQWVQYAKNELEKSDVLVCTVIGFPHGTHQPQVKAFEALEAVKDGADELDMVINVYALKAFDDSTIFNEIKGVVEAGTGRTVKVIIEACYLTADEIVRACELAKKAGAHFVKTSTGFGTYGARVEDVKLMKDTVKDALEVKASGGVRTYEDALKMIEVGATRIGTSNGVDIVNQKGVNKNDSNTSY